MLDRAPRAPAFLCEIVAGRLPRPGSSSPTGRAPLCQGACRGDDLPGDDTGRRPRPAGTPFGAARSHVAGAPVVAQGGADPLPARLLVGEVPQHDVADREALVPEQDALL